MFVNVTFNHIEKYFHVFPVDSLSVNFFIDRAASRGVGVSPILTWGEEHNTCEQNKVADSIKCTNYNVYCIEPDDNIIFRVAVPGRNLYRSISCGDLVKDKFDF